MKIMVAYDGTVQGKEALAYGLNKARETGGEVVALYVFDNSLFLDYDAHIDAEAMARREAARFVDEAKALIREKGDGVRASVFTTDGNPEEEVIAFAKEKRADLLVCPPGFRGIVNTFGKSQKTTAFCVETQRREQALLPTKAI